MNCNQNPDGTARRIRKASSVNRSRGQPTHRITFFSRSPMPSKASTIPVSWLYAMALMVMGYVPMQNWETPYPISHGFMQGTIFPSLDYPFMMGGCRKWQR